MAQSHAPSAPVALTSLVKFLVLFFLMTMMGGLDAQILGPQKTHMVFYLQDWKTGDNATAVPVAGTNGTLSSVLNFGTIMVVDDALTDGPDRQSKQVGRAQGIYVNSALDGSDLHLLFSIVFTNEKYNGSTLEIQGSDRFFLKQREVSVVAGTGLFRYAQGHVVLETVYLDYPNLNAVIKYNVTVHHY